jgi:hypothetical protein
MAGFRLADSRGKMCIILVMRTEKIEAELHLKLRTSKNVKVRLPTNRRLVKTPHHLFKIPHFRGFVATVKELTEVKRQPTVAL